jgi:hypothetical protein
MMKMFYEKCFTSKQTEPKIIVMIFGEMLVTYVESIRSSFFFFNHEIHE